MIDQNDLTDVVRYSMAVLYHHATPTSGGEVPYRLDAAKDFFTRAATDGHREAMAAIADGLAQFATDLKGNKT